MKIVVLCFSKVRCSYGILNSISVARKSFTFRSKNNNKTHGNLKLFLVTGFELVYAIIAVYFSTCSVSCGNGILFPFAINPAYVTYNGTF